MDSESVKIKDLFLEILQPLVNRLCGFGVFYSKEAARVSDKLIIAALNFVLSSAEKEGY